MELKLTEQEIKIKTVNYNDMLKVSEEFLKLAIKKDVKKMKKFLTKK